MTTPPDRETLALVLPFTSRAGDRFRWSELFVEAAEALVSIGLTHYGVNVLSPRDPREAVRLLDEAALACQEARSVLVQHGHHATRRKVDIVHARVLRALLAATNVPEEPQGRRRR